ncbi:hypothetical protein BCV70DRAFT_158426 [Testicularia cyperi]|uniref:Alpha/beta-hydrolase n=1 Tax=Testicularia cyperi TaxID=1882483 RepID=A0A317XSU8_9BASI|nr:hypothetical protein BCV70DRAFT_158426 [Testicularia cyperi]
MAHLIPGDASMLATRLLVLTVWGVTPFCWTQLLLRLVYLYLSRFQGVSLDQLVLSRLSSSSGVLLSVFKILQLEKWVDFLRPSRRPVLSTIFYTYCTAEVIFSIYYAHLCRQIQRPGPRPLYGRRFLRGVFAQALEAGLKTPHDDSHANGARSSYASAISRFPTASNVANGVTHRSTSTLVPEQSQESGAPTDVRQRLKRLRAASFVPEFVHRPLTADDPRAKKFQQDQAKWFFDAPTDHITRRDVMHWLAWSLFATELEELEAERTRALQLEASPKKNKDTDELEVAKELASATPSTFNSPMPPSQARFGSVPTDRFETKMNGNDNVVLQEDVRGTRAKKGEWDPTTGDRMRFLEYCLELLEARQGRSYPVHPPSTSAPSSASGEGQSQSHDGEDSILVKTRRRIRMMRLTIDPVRTASRPLGFYLLTNTLSWLTVQRAKLAGFELHHEGRLPYLLRLPRSNGAESSKIAGAKEQQATPLIVLHGLGIGLAQYSSLISFFIREERFRERPILILLQPNISQSFFSPAFLSPFGHHETTMAFRRILRARGWESIDVLSHSYGSLVHSWLIKSLGSMVRRSCFVDPVCFQLWVPFVCGNFLYKRCSNPIELLMRYFVAREVATANTLCRYFDWSSNILWPNEIERLKDHTKTRFFLAQHDAILSAKDTREYLVECGTPHENIYWGTNMAHGEMLMHGGPAFRQIVDWLCLES